MAQSIDGMTTDCPFSRDPNSFPGQSSCPAEVRADKFDVFGEEYQLDPAEALRWAREEKPVFYSASLGYWIVTRYDDVKSVFRDNLTFSPRNALEKITPSTPEAVAVLEKHNYGMNRTLVNEDEPAHMERRRALLFSFLPDELAKHEAMVRRLTREYVDRFIDCGETDLVDEMLWEIPLTVALHFFGVPEEDMATLRHYSIAHTLNTWGRPSPDEQVALADSVGKFWGFAGRVLDKMRLDPAGDGWMEYAIRRQRELPEVVTDSYLHSMMMAGIVAAHETTANATANALKLLLENRESWDAICRDPSLIPNAVEESLRYSGSIVAWRRYVTRDCRVGSAEIPQGAKLLVVMSSANHDQRHFAEPDRFDIYRDKPGEHLSFGYGSHQCMGKNLARMEMRIFIEELSRRIPHMELVPDQHFTYLPNTSMRGPDHLLVRWDPALNPERRDERAQTPRISFPIGSTLTAARTVTVVAVEQKAQDVVELTLEDVGGRDLPGWTAGAHVDLLGGGYERRYSLCGNPRDGRYQIAVLREPEGRGGSRFIHEQVERRDQLRIRGPRNHFKLDEDAAEFILVAGGIGITPILAMADRLKELGRSYVVHYCGKSRDTLAFLDRLERDHGQQLHVYARQDGQRLDLPAVLRAAPDSAHVYACGPERLLAELGELISACPELLHVERFAPVDVSDGSADLAFDVELADSQLSLHVPADRTLLQVLHGAGIDVQSDCEEGLCGSCEVGVVSGEIDHRDAVLSSAERAENQRLMTCCSRAANGCALRLRL